MVPLVITDGAIVRARVTLWQHERAASSGVHDLDALDDIVIARSVIPDDLDDIPSNRRASLKPKMLLRPNGTLVAIVAQAVVRAWVMGALSNQVHAYVRANGHGLFSLVASPLWLDSDKCDGLAKPDVVLYRRERGDLVPIAVFEFEVAHRSGRQMIENAATYLEHRPSIECLVSNMIFSPRQVILDE